MSARTIGHLLCRHILLLRVNEGPNFIALQAAYAKLADVGIMVGSTGAPKVLKKPENSVFRHASYSTCGINGGSFNKGRNDLRLLRS
jgi:hypothetical protein